MIDNFFTKSTETEGPRRKSKDKSKDKYLNIQKGDNK
jgi:hypothetical protein